MRRTQRLANPRSSILLATGSLCALLFACGADTGNAADAGTDAGEHCFSAGGSQTGCTCSSQQPLGHRYCQPNLIWSACSCPPAEAPNHCIEGQDVVCDPCPGQTTGRMTKCLQSGTFDCGC
jgi:hypothetical protein